MGSSTHRTAAWAWFIAALVVTFGNPTTVQASEAIKQNYPETIAVLQMLYAGEVRAGYGYKIFAKAAADEGYANISHMLAAMAASEAVHARNFERILLSLGVQIADVDTSSIKASTTKNNLKFATEVELAEIDREYPRYLNRIRTENHAEAIKYIAYAWEAEKQHRALIREIRSGTGFFFNKLLDYFRSNPSRYYVNRICGATVTELPKDKCPICHHPLDTYLEIPRL